jgi:hypothetical protein
MPITVRRNVLCLYRLSCCLGERLRCFLGCFADESFMGLCPTVRAPRNAASRPLLRFLLAILIVTPRWLEHGGLPLMDR